MKKVLTDIAGVETLNRIDETIKNIKSKKKFIALSNGAVIDANEIMYLSQIEQCGEDDDYRYYMTVIFRSNTYYHNLYYSSVDDAEEDYWLIRHALLDENDSDMICE